MRYLKLLLLSLVTQAAFATSPAMTRNFADVSKAARERHTPILVIFSAESCSYCIKLKQEVIDPLARQPDHEGRPMIREFDINAGGKVTDFDGERIRSRLFKRRYGIYATPTLVIVDPDGRLLSDPIVGYNSAREYRQLLQQSLLQANSRGALE
jgi:thioredoxin-related protein